MCIYRTVRPYVTPKVTKEIGTVQWWYPYLRLGYLEDEQLPDSEMDSWVSVRTVSVFEGFDSNYVIYVFTTA